MEKYVKFPFLNERNKTETMALIFFATFGEASKWEIFKEAGRRQKLSKKSEKEQELKQNEKKLSYSTVHRGVKSLLENHLIEITKIEDSSRNAQIQVEYYKLSRKGLAKLLPPLRVLYGDEVENRVEIGKYVLEIIGGLLKNYPEMYPPEFHEFSEPFKDSIAIDFSINYMTRDEWDLLPLMRAYTNDEADFSSFYMNLLFCKHISSEEYREPMQPVLDLMTEKDVKVVAKLVERLLNQSTVLIKIELEG